MAVIKTNALAPDAKTHFAFSNVEFDLAPGDKFETDDRIALGDAVVHPWLEVSYPEADEVVTVAPEAPAEQAAVETAPTDNPDAKSRFGKEK